jgi:hypothetical protein
MASSILDMSISTMTYAKGAKVKQFFIIVLSGLILSAGVNGAEPVGAKLTPRLKELLADEMRQVAEATGDIALAIATGDHESVHRLAGAVRDSFILKQSLTDQDRKDLMSAVPAEFVLLDKHFHGLAGKLAQQAEIQDSELQGYYFSEMLNACVACHRQFATDRFPGLSEKQVDKH